MICRAPAIDPPITAPCSTDVDPDEPEKTFVVSEVAGNEAAEPSAEGIGVMINGARCGVVTNVEGGGVVTNVEGGGVVTNVEGGRVDANVEGGGVVIKFEAGGVVINVEGGGVGFNVVGTCVGPIGSVEEELPLNARAMKSSSPLDVSCQLPST